MESVRAHTLGVVSQPAEKLFDLPALLKVEKEPVERFLLSFEKQRVGVVDLPRPRVGKGLGELQGFRQLLHLQYIGQKAIFSF